ncbi:MAG TPA: hypothetical protein VGW38_28365 [Chloroflexota bacterium]|nr:hypothetical protein [Chloroflexota bacterium]
MLRRGRCIRTTSTIKNSAPSRRVARAANRRSDHQALGHPPGVDPQRFHLIAPYTKDARQWTKLRWIDVYSGERFAIAARGTVSGQGTARVQSFRDVIARYRMHPETKSLGPDGMPCGKRTVGLLQWRLVTLGELVHIGKEANRLEVVEQGLVHDWDEVQLVFREPEAESRGPTDPPIAKQAQRKCRSCESDIEGPRLLYCSPACRQRAYRRRTAPSRN